MKYFNEASKTIITEEEYTTLIESEDYIETLDEDKPVYLQLTDEVAETIPALLLDQEFKTEQCFVKCELDWCDLQLQYLADVDYGETRAVLTETAVREYKVILRNYIKAGVVVGDKPVRPI